ncbi:hypothetical protein HYH02_009744 [Chlamydomonas schloesseri]|uniref:Uncharacterized protein n=1 Tax=Chlamydomonas schloesseri TaxID=2026947 RepID=A0A835TQ13_9CHLO|nr:hypothetical protein HYH02_009744 [Chlamydomonas schloesseri]|eukprot:KAG2441950.1 hypothetical protein HYH02_009744 [Chlamydomonas schloesseri]
MVLSEVLGVVILIWRRVGDEYWGNWKLLPTSPTHVACILASGMTSGMGAGHYDGVESTTHQPLASYIDLPAVAPKGWDPWCEGEATVQEALRELRVQALGDPLIQAMLAGCAQLGSRARPGAEQEAGPPGPR